MEEEEKNRNDEYEQAKEDCRQLGSLMAGKDLGYCIIVIEGYLYSQVINIAKEDPGDGRKLARFFNKRVRECMEKALQDINKRYTTGKS